MNTPSQWSSRIAFVFAAAAAAIGLGNIWRFPYLAGQNGGGAFVLIYLLFVVVLGIPFMTSEVVLGRIGRRNPIGSLAQVAKLAKKSRHWGIVGGISVWAAFLIVSYYVVISGWVLDYLVRAILGKFQHITEAQSIAQFKDLQANAWQMILSSTLVVIASMATIMVGIKAGLERVVMILFPALLGLMVLLLGYAMTTNYFGDAARFLFTFHFDSITPKIVLMALGQAFFSLNISMGIIIMFSAYMPERAPIISSVIAVIAADTAIALLAGMIIFPIVFATGLKPSIGPSLIFQTLPIAFGAMAWGSLIGSLFFLLLFLAAFTSSIALLEVPVAWLVENHHFSRPKATITIGILCWIVSLGTVFSFSHDHHWDIHGINFFEAIDFTTSSLMLPISAFFIALFTGWWLPSQLICEKLGWQANGFWFKSWRLTIRYIAPVAILLILLSCFGIL